MTTKRRQQAATFGFVSGRNKFYSLKLSDAYPAGTYNTSTQPAVGFI